MRNRAVLFCALAMFAGCSASEQSADKNTISPYDQEFNPDTSAADVNANLAEEDYLERAKSAYDRGLYTVARENWSTLREQYPSSFYATLAELKIADTYFYAGDYSTAATSYEEFLKLHPAHEATPYVRFQLGNAQRQLYAGLEHDQGPLQLALKHYMKLIDDYPSSEFVLPARREIASCRELLAEHEHFIARFYAHQGYENARVKRLEDLIRDFPETLAAQKARADLSDHAPGTPVVLASVASLDSPKLKSKGRDAQKASTPSPDLGIVKKQKPGTPKILMAGNREIDSGKSARFALNKPSRIDESELLSKGKTEKTTRSAKADTSGLRFLNCSEEHGLQVFTARFQSNVEILGTAAKAPNKYVLRNIGAKMPAGVLQPDDSRVIKNCEVGTSRVSITPVRGSNDVFVAEIQGEKTAKAEVFTLDRPSRLIVILDN